MKLKTPNKVLLLASLMDKIYNAKITQSKTFKKLMKKTRMVWAGIAFVVAITFSLRGQVTVPAIPAGTVSLSATNIR
ncbi:MAG: hypothetical protein WBN75_16385, partial [Verrucomicrobiia bacterium]